MLQTFSPHGYKVHINVRVMGTTCNAQEAWSAVKLSAPSNPLKNSGFSMHAFIQKKEESDKKGFP